MKYFLILILLLPIHSALSAPHPTITSSQLMKELKGVYVSPLGFRLDGRKTNWTHSKPPKDSRYIVTMFKSKDSKNNVQATLTVRVDKLRSSRPQLKKYVKRWLREYPRYGFDILGSKKFSLNRQKGWVVDLTNKETQRQVRQAIFIQDSHAVVLTCRDHIQSFKKSLPTCNEIIRTFQW